MFYRADLETMPLERLRDWQLARLNGLLREILPANRFYARKLDAVSTPIAWATFENLPFTTKHELIADQSEYPPLGTIATYPLDRYVVHHQTSGTSGRPLRVLDTEASWQWWAECWQYVYAAAGVTARDRIFFAFSFGPFIGFWSSHEAARRLGAMTIPGGGMDSRARLLMIRDTKPTVVLSTPTYALRLAEVAASEALDLRSCGVRATIHAGEPGASIPQVRARIEEAWGASAFDHAGATEVGAFAFPCESQTALHLNEAEFIFEVLDPGTGTGAAPGETGELVVTNLGRAGWPVIRYRTGDLVTLGDRACACGRSFLSIPGGVIGRADDLMIVRGVNVYPSAIEAVVRQFDVDEFRMVRTFSNGMEELTVELECRDAEVGRVGDALRTQIGIRIPVVRVDAGALPRFELKAKRVVDRRSG